MVTELGRGLRLRRDGFHSFGRTTAPPSGIMPIWKGVLSSQAENPRFKAFFAPKKWIRLSTFDFKRMP